MNDKILFQSRMKRYLAISRSELEQLKASYADLESTDTQAIAKQRSTIVELEQHQQAIEEQLQIIEKSDSNWQKFAKESENIWRTLKIRLRQAKHYLFEDEFFQQRANGGT